MNIPVIPECPGAEPAARRAQSDEIGRCEDCRWWDNSTQLADATPDSTGACRRRPPVADERNGRACWPFTEDNDWCAEFAPGNHGMAP